MEKVRGPPLNIHHRGKLCKGRVQNKFITFFLYAIDRLKNDVYFRKKIHIFFAIFPFCGKIMDVENSFADVYRRAAPKIKGGKKHEGV